MEGQIACKVVMENNEESMEVDVHVDVESIDPESTHTHAQQGCTSKPSKHNCENNIKVITNKDVVEDSVLDSKDEAEHGNETFVVGNKTIENGSDELDVDFKNNSVPCSSQNIEETRNENTCNFQEEISGKSMACDALFGRHTASHSPPVQGPSDVKHPPPCPANQPVLRLTNFSITHILKPNFGKKRRKTENSAFTLCKTDHNSHVDYSDIR